jgi:hypothetical protein
MLVSTRTTGSLLKQMNARRINLTIKPSLSEIRFILENANRDHGLNRVVHVYKDQLDTIHVDESWFYLKRVNNQVIIVAGTDIPQRPTAQHKSHIENVMFLVVFATPRLIDDVRFDDKIGLWPCVERTPAVRNSKNRPAGTMVTTSRSLYSDYCYELFTMDCCVLDTIKEKLPWKSNKTLKIQQNGARPHTGHNSNARIAAAESTEGWKITIFNQPAQSPDLNILDLCHKTYSCIGELMQCCNL